MPSLPPQKNLWNQDDIYCLLNFFILLMYYTISSLCEWLFCLNCKFCGLDAITEEHQLQYTIFSHTPVLQKSAPLPLKSGMHV